MERREFLTSSLAASALALAKESSAQPAAPTPSGKPRTGGPHLTQFHKRVPHLRREAPKVGIRAKLETASRHRRRLRRIRQQIQRAVLNLVHQVNPSSTFPQFK